MMKLIGCLMVLLGCASVGLLEGRRKLVELRMLQDMIQGLEVLEREFALNKSPLPDMLEKAAAARRYERVRYVFSCCAQEAEKGIDFTEKWREALKGFNPDAQVLELLQGLCGILGRYDDRGQVQSVARVRKELERCLADAGREVRDKCRLYAVLGGCVGGVLSIMLV